MLSIVTTLVLPALFLGSAGLGVTVLAGTWRTYAGAYRRLQAELAACDGVQAVAITLARLEVRRMGMAPRPVAFGAVGATAARREGLRPEGLRPGGRIAVSPARAAAPAGAALPARPAAA